LEEYSGGGKNPRHPGSNYLPGKKTKKGGDKGREKEGKHPKKKKGGANPHVFKRVGFGNAPPTRENRRGKGR